VTTFYEQQPGESAESAAERTGAAPDIAPIPYQYLRQAVQRLATSPEPVGWLLDIENETEREAGQ
jgi:hypothetical protein